MNNHMFHRILLWVEENLYSGADIGTLVSLCDCSRRTLESGFRRRAGMTPREYLLRRRMTRAAVMLRMTSLPVTEIAVMLGYYSGQNFARAFRRTTGCTPTAHRKNTVWDTRTLQTPLQYEESIPRPTMVRFSRERRIAGERLSARSRFDAIHNDDYLSFIRKRMEHQSEANGPVTIISSVPDTGEVYFSRQGLVSVETVVGRVAGEDEEAAGIIPAGWYSRYAFRGTWTAFVVFSRTLYLKSLAEERRCWSGKMSFMQVYAADDVNLTCVYYIPVTTAEN